MAAKGLFEQLLASQWEGLTTWVDNHEPESLHLDFKIKSHHAPHFDDGDRSQLAVALSAFANTEGGVLVYGVSTSKEPKHEPDRAQRVVPVLGLGRFHRTAEEQIHTLTDPPVPGVRITSVAAPEAADSGVLAVYVPSSDGGPHRVLRAAEKCVDRYYMRTATSSVVMPHAMLAALFNRRTPPKLELVARIARHGNDRLDIHLFLRNRGRGAAERAALQLAVVPGEASWLTNIGACDGWVKLSDGPISGKYVLTFHSTPTIALFPGMEAMVAYVIAPVRADPLTDAMKVPLWGTIHALGSQPRTFGEDIVVGRSKEVVLPGEAD